MPRHNPLIEKVISALTATDEPVEAVLKRLGVDYETGRRLVQSKPFQKALARWRGYMAQLREIDLARAAVKGAGNVLRGASAAANEEGLSSNGRIVSTSAIRLAQKGEKNGTNREKKGTKTEQTGTVPAAQRLQAAIRPVMTGENLAAYHQAQKMKPWEDPLGEMEGMKT